MALTKIPSSLLDTSGGFDLQGNITLGDSEKIILGTGSDLEIYHDGSNSFIRDNGDGDLFIEASNNHYLRFINGEYAIVTTENAGVGLRYNNVEKIVTTDAGATVTGTLTVTGDLDITGNVNSYNVTDLDVTDQTITLGAGQTEANSGGSGIIIDGSSASILWNETDSVFDFNKDISLDNGLFFSEQDFYLYRSGADVASLRVGDDGSHKYFSFTDTGTVARFSSASGAVSLGSGANDHILINSSGLVMIGTSTPSGLLNVDGSLHYGGQLRVNDPSHDGTESNPSICVGYDNDNGFFRPTSNTIAMTTAGTERMRITATGNVAIANTSTINAKLHIGSATATGNATNPALQIGGASTYRLGMFTTAEGGVIDNANGDDGLQFHTKNAGEAVRITADGNLQMMAQTSSFASPGFTYHTNNYLYCRGGSAGLILSDDSGINTVQIIDGASGYINFETGDGSSRIRIDSSGNVGIGTSSPYHTFDVFGAVIANGAAKSNGLFFDTTSATTGTGGGIALGGYSNGTGGAIYHFGNIQGIKENSTAGNYASAMLFSTRANGATPTERMRIDSAGHLILGSNISTTEAGKLTVYTDATNDSAIYGYRSTSYFRIVPFLSNGAFSSLSNVNDSGLFFSDNFVIAKHATGNLGAIFHGTGSIFIGTESEATGSTGGATFSADSSNRRNLILATTSTGSLELIEFRNPNGTVGTIKTSGTSTSYNTSSDYRLKENVTYEFNALDRVTQLKPARFNFMTDADTVLDGFLAHEVSSIVPEAVSGEKDATKEEEYEVTPAQYEDDGETLISEAVMETRTVPVYQGIDQSKLVPLLTKAIQELKTELDAAKARITELEG